MRSRRSWHSTSSAAAAVAPSAWSCAWNRYCRIFPLVVGTLLETDAITSRGPIPSSFDSSSGVSDSACRPPLRETKARRRKRTGRAKASLGCVSTGLRAPVPPEHSSSRQYCQMRTDAKPRSKDREALGRAPWRAGAYCHGRRGPPSPGPRARGLAANWASSRPSWRGPAGCSSRLPGHAARRRRPLHRRSRRSPTRSRPCSQEHALPAPVVGHSSAARSPCGSCAAGPRRSRGS